jgi:hypothetical protein
VGNDVRAHCLLAVCFCNTLNMYNILWLRLLGYDNLLPQQQQRLDAMRDWYAIVVLGAVEIVTSHAGTRITS